LDDNVSPPEPIGLQPFFAQLDTDGNGGLDRKELERALKLVGIRNVDFDAIFKTLDADGDGLITFQEFQDALPASTRQAIEDRTNAEGVMESLYLPPEDWTDTQTAAELQWEQMVQYQAKRFGNGLKQNDILSNELGKG